MESTIQKSKHLRKAIIKKLDMLLAELQKDRKENDLELPAQGQNPNC